MKDNTNIVSGIIVAVVASIIIFTYQQQQEINNLSTYSSRLTLAQDKSNNLTVIDKPQNPEIYYRVTLQ